MTFADGTIQTRDFAVDAAWSQWSSVFAPTRKDHFRTSKASFAGAGNECRNLLIDRPVFVLPIVELHAGHIIVDLLEQLFDAMQSAYGEVRRDALIVVDINKHRDIQKSLYDAIHDSRSTHTLSLLRLFTEVPVISVDTLREFLRSASARAGGPEVGDACVGDDSSAFVVVRDLHVGLDISHSSYNVGSKFHPVGVRRGDSALMRSLSDRYLRFQSWLAEGMMRHGIISSRSESEVLFSGVLVVQRKGNRVIMNLLELVSRLREVTGAEPMVVDLDEEPFHRQLELFRRTKVLVAVAGTALHNMLFMLHRPATVIALMQPGWCDRSWVYVNQAALLGIEPIVVCADSYASPLSPPLTRPVSLYFHDNRLVDFYDYGWLDGPFSSKFDCIHVDVNRLGNNGFDSRVPSRSNKIQINYVDAHDAVIEMIESVRHAYRLHPNHDLVEIYASNISSTPLDENNLYSSCVSLELAYKRPLLAVYDLLYSAHPSLCVCVQLHGFAEYGGNRFRKQCFPQTGISTFAELNISVYIPYVVAHLWLQTSVAGFKIPLSDLYLPLMAPFSKYYGLTRVFTDPDLFGKIIRNRTLSVTFQFEASSVGRLFEIDSNEYSDSYPRHYLQRRVREFILGGNYNKSEELVVTQNMMRVLHEFVGMFDS
jgi:hypothetical protein